MATRLRTIRSGAVFQRFLFAGVKRKPISSFERFSGSSSHTHEERAAALNHLCRSRHQLLGRLVFPMAQRVRKYRNRDENTRTDASFQNGNQLKTSLSKLHCLDPESSKFRFQGNYAGVSLVAIGDQTNRDELLN